MKLSRFAIIALVLSASFALAGSDAQKSFNALKTLEGNWEGKNSQGQTVAVSFRMTAGGSALMSEIHGAGTENMITMFHLDGDRLMMTHYCGVGNQPRMLGKMAPDGKQVAFDFLDVTNFNSTQPGHMQQLLVSIADPNHHIEDWTFLGQDGKQQLHQRFDLQRAK